MTPLSQTADDNSEELLVAIGTHRDRAAFEALFQRYSGRIYGLGMKIARNEQLARDLVQDVMLAIWQGSRAYNAQLGSAKTWIFTLARNKCIDALRLAKRRPITLSSDDIWPEDYLDSELPGLRAHQETNADNEIDEAKIATLRNQLPTPQRKAIEMVYVYDHTHEEAAASLSIPLGTLKSRLRLGVLKLKEMVVEKND